MWKLLILIIFVVFFHKGIATGSTSLARQNDMSGPVSHIMENLVIHTKQVADELGSQLSTKIDGTTQTILGDIEVILASALEQLTEPIIEAQSILSHPECQQLLTMEELRERIDSQLMICTKDLNDLLFAFQNDSDQYTKSLQSGAQQIVDLPSQCEENDYSFGSITACFIEKISELNHDLALLLNRASMSIIQTHHLTKQSTEAALTCADHVVAQTVEYMDKILTQCQNNVK
ncbi:uncharacterized protein LOC106082875 [Stomoxys calcitrans]|uniref:uncharacterized protein LOC106082875 n=1 Tax=Stomoxys calcitrans TaxID=35570 RepID=UPI0027E33367|nr:uncharacterized protein LOC106082875 [Stomoxys calcitrans]